MRSNLRKGIYRSRNGAIFGSAGDWRSTSIFPYFWVRFVAVIVLVFSGLWPAMILYILAALIMKPEPVMPLSSADEQRFYDHYTSSGMRPPSG